LNIFVETTKIRLGEEPVGESNVELVAIENGN
jgi:hypothetical protein